MPRRVRTAGWPVFRQEDWAGSTAGAQHGGAGVAAGLGVRTGGIVMLVGASGAGKSSLMRAGLGPAVQEGALGPGSWPTLVLTPTVDPLKELTRLVPELAEPRRRRPGSTISTGRAPARDRVP